MPMERSITRSMPFLPRYRSLSSAIPNKNRQFPEYRSRSQPSQRIAYFQGTVTKYFAHSRSAHHSPSPQRVYLLCAGNSKTIKSPLTRVSRSGSYNDLYSSHVFSTLECFDAGGATERPEIEVDARAAGVSDIYHKGPFRPDRTLSESGVSMNCSVDSSMFCTEEEEDDTASQISSYGGSSSAFHEMTIDSELDRLESCDDSLGLKSPRDSTSSSSSWFRFRERAASPDDSTPPSSPFPSYANARKRELMSSPSWEFDKTLAARQKALRVLIPAPDGSLVKERLRARKDSGGSGGGGGASASSSSSSTPLAQSTPHVSPRSFMGPRLSVKGCWNVDDPYDEGIVDTDSQVSKRTDDSSCYSSFSEDNLSDISSSKQKTFLSTRKVKLTKKASDLPAKRSNQHPGTSSGRLSGQEQLDKTLVSEESFENIYVPPLESVLGEHTGGKPEGDASSWWAVFNIGSAHARSEEEKDKTTSPTAKPEIKIVKPTNTGIPLISPGKHGQKKLKRLSESSPPPPSSPNNDVIVPSSPTSSSPSSSSSSSSSSPLPDSDKQSDVTQLMNDVRDREETAGNVRELPSLLQLDGAQDVLKPTPQNLNHTDSGAFSVVRASGSSSSHDIDSCLGISEEDLVPVTVTLFSEHSQSISDKAIDEFSRHVDGNGNGNSDGKEAENAPTSHSHHKGAQPMQDDVDSSRIFSGCLPFAPSFVTAAALSSPTQDDDDDDNDNDDDGNDNVDTKRVPEENSLSSKRTQSPQADVLQQNTSYPESDVRSITCKTSQTFIILDPNPSPDGHHLREELNSSTTPPPPPPCPPRDEDVDLRPDDESDRSELEPEGAHGRHYVLDNSDTRDQEASAIYTPLHIPGGEKPQVLLSAAVVESESRIAEVVGGSSNSSGNRSSSSSSGSGSSNGGGSLGLREASELTPRSHTPGIAVVEEGTDIISSSASSSSSRLSGSCSSSSSSSVEQQQSPGESVVFGISVFTESYCDKDNTIPTIRSADCDTSDNEVETLCSEFTSVLNISDPDDTLVEVGEETEVIIVEENSSKDEHAEDGERYQSCIEPTPEEEIRDTYQCLEFNNANGNFKAVTDNLKSACDNLKSARDDLKSASAKIRSASDNLKSASDILKSDEVLLSSQPIVVEEENGNVNEQLGNLGGNVGFDLEESKQTDPSSTRVPNAESSLDTDDHLESDTDMDWRFVDRRFEHRRRRGDGDEEMQEEQGRQSPPHLVTVAATAELTTHNCDTDNARDHQWLRFSQCEDAAADGDGDSRVPASLSNNGFDENAIHHATTSDYHKQEDNPNLLSQQPLRGDHHDLDERLTSRANNTTNHDAHTNTNTNTNTTMETEPSHADLGLLTLEKDVESRSSVIIDVDRSMDDEGNLRGDEGIPPLKKADAQFEDGDGDGGVEERRHCKGGEYEFSSHSSRSRSGGLTADDNCLADSEFTTPLSQQVEQVKRIHRKTVEETVTIERSSCNSSKSASSGSSSSCSSKFAPPVSHGCFEEECDHRVEYITTNRKEIVIREEDETFTTTTTTKTTTPPVSSDNNNVCNSQSVDGHVSSDDFSVNVDRENNPFVVIDDVNRLSSKVTLNQKLSDYSDDSQPLPHQPVVIVATPTPIGVDPTSSLHPSPHTHLPIDASVVTEFQPRSENSHTSAMRWSSSGSGSGNDGLTGPTATTTRHTTTSLDPSHDPNNIAGQDNNNYSSMVIVAERSDGLNLKAPVTFVTHRSALDQLQEQLSHISGGGEVVVGEGEVSSCIPPHQHYHHPYQYQPTPVYHDHGEATTTTHVGEVTGNVNNKLGHRTATASIDLDRSPRSPVANIIINNNNNESGISKVEIYDNDYDYDYPINDQSKEATVVHHHPPRQNHLLKSGLNTSSSLWTLKEETDSLLEALSPIASPKRVFVTTPVDEREEEISTPTTTTTTNTSNNNNNNNNNTNSNDDSQTKSATPQSQYEIEKRKFNMTLDSMANVFGQSKLRSPESSELDESDGNYSSISTSDSSSYRSSGYGRERTPLSESDSAVPRDLGGANDTVNNCHHHDQATTVIPIPASQAMKTMTSDNDVSSFNEFVSGLEIERLTSDWTRSSQSQAASGSVSVSDDNNGVGGQQSLVYKFGDSQNGADPKMFKSSLAFCVNTPTATTPPPSHYQIPSHYDQDQEMSIDNHIDSSNAHSVFQFQHSNASTHPHTGSTTFNINDSAPLAKRKLNIISRSAGIPRFPVEEDSSINMSSSSSSTTHGITDDVHNEASSRLYTLDLDLSRISSCASPTPSDVSSDVSSMFTCKGTAEIKRGHSVSFGDDYDMLPVSNWHIPTSTPKPLKSVLKKSTRQEVSLDHGQSRESYSYHQTWVKQFDQILDDFDSKTSALGPGSEVTVMEDTTHRPMHAGSSPSLSSGKGPNMNDLYKTFTNEDSEKKQNHLCPVVEDDNMSTFRFKRFLKKSHTKRNSKGRRLVRFLSKLNCVSESVVQSPDLSATRKMARLDNGQAYGTDIMPPLPERGHQQTPTFSAASPQRHHHHHHQQQQQHYALSHCKDSSPNSSIHSLDSCPSRTDSAYSSISESLSGMPNSPRESRYYPSSSSSPSSSRLPTNSFSSVGSSGDTFHPDTTSSSRFFLDSAHSSTSDYSSMRAPSMSETTDPFSPGPVMTGGRGYGKEMLTALSDVFDQLDVCEGEIDTALLDRLRSGHHAVHFSKDA